MADAAQGLSVVIDDEDNSVRVDPVTGTVETDQPDGGVVVQLDAKRLKKDDAEPNDFYKNLVEEIAPAELSRLAEELYESIKADEQSRGNYLEIRTRGLELLGLEIKETRANAADTSAAVEGQSTVTNPLLLEACLKGWANAQAELLPSEGPVKVQDEADDGIEAEDALADALERDMNHYLTVTATEYYPDTSHMLLWGVYFGGSGFKKVYRCPMRRRVVSESVDAKDLIVSDTMKDLRSCARITHQIPMRPSVMKRMRLIGAYRSSTALTQPTPTVNAVDAEIAAIQGTDPNVKRPEDQPYTIWETQCELDLPDCAPGKFKGEGIPLPYLVTMAKDSHEILAIRRDWKEDDDECERKRMYVKYPYVPGPGFYGTGMLHILGNSSMAMTGAWRLALDAAMYANFPAGVISKLGGRQNTSDIRPGPGTFVPIETNGQDIRGIIQGLPYKDVTAGLLTLMDKITTQSRETGGVADLPAGEGVSNVPVGTMLTLVEQATKVMAAAHKGMHQAQAEEIELIVDLLRDNPEDFWKNNKICPKGFWTEEKFIQALNDCNLVPRSDPNTPSHIHRIAKAVALTQLIAIPAIAPLMSAKETLMRCLRALREDPNGLVVDPPPMPAQPTSAGAAPPDPLIGQARMLTAQTQAKKAELDAQNDQIKNQIDQAKLGVEKDIATTDLAKEMVIHREDAARDERQAVRDSSLAQQQHGLDTQQHGLAVQQAVHEHGMDLAQHALDVHQVLNPPESPKKSGE